MMSLFVLKLLSNLALALGSMAIGSAITVVVIQLRRRRQPVHPADQSRTEDAARTQAAIEQIRQLAVDVASDVGNHSETMEGWSAQLDASRSGGEAGVLEIQSLVEGMLDANHQLHARLKLAEQKIATQAEEIRTQESNAKTDALTGLANRRLFDSELSTAILSSSTVGEACSLIIFDIDHFKKFNDAHGHLAGDEVLRTVAGAVGNIIRKPYLAARYGGEEFAAILPNTSAQQAQAIADRIRFAIQETSVSFEGKVLSVTASIGVAEAFAEEQPRDLVRRADEAVYAAKAAGRNCCYWHDGRQTLAIASLAKEPSAKGSTAPACRVKTSIADIINVHATSLPAASVVIDSIRDRLASRNGAEGAISLLHIRPKQLFALNGYDEQRSTELLSDLIATVVTATRRDADLIASLGEGEFLVALPGISESAARIVSQRIRTAIASHLLATETGTTHLHVEVGVVEIDGSIELVEAIELAKYLSMPEELAAKATKPMVLAGNP